MELDASHVVSDVFVAEPSVVSSSDHASCELPLRDGPVRATDLAEFEPCGMEMAMTLNQADAVTGDELAPIKCHRWTFPCAEDFALRGNNYFSFVQCLLEMQRNVQVYEEGDVLAPNLVRACKLFVAGQCGEGYTGEMYHLFSHFLCNSRVFDEWEAFLRVAFEAPQASAETLLTMQVEQVWLRFRRLADTLEDIFGVLDRRYTWHHRLPKVGELLHEQIFRHCGLEVIVREFFSQEKTVNDTMKDIKRALRALDQRASERTLG